jgi:hypothetical protein
MKLKYIIASFILTALVSFIVSPSFSQQEDEFYGDFLFGYRYVDTTGTLSKYKEDFNLFNGVRLFNFNLHYQPQKGLKIFDRLDIFANNMGGDPFESLSIYAQKYGTYQLRYDRRKSNYFYQDKHENSGDLYDLHSFDYDRVRDTGSLKLMLHRSVSLQMSFDRYSKKGESTTTFDINRIEFEFDEPVEEDYKQASIGLNVQLNNHYSFLFEEQIMDYKNSNSLFIPGYADGGDSAGYPSALNYFYLNQPYKTRSNLHSLKFNINPFDNLLLKGAIQVRNQEMDLDYSESASGTNYLDRLFSYDLIGSGSFERNIQLYDFDLTYLLMNKLGIVAAFRYHDFNQDGTFLYDDVSETGSLGYNTLGFEGGLQYQFSPRFTVTAGYRNENRKYEGTETVNYEEKTRRDGFFGNINLKINQLLHFTADYQHGIYDNPFTLISPTDFYRLRVTGRLKYQDFNLTASYLRNQTKSDILKELWESHSDQINIRAGYKAGSINVSAGYSLISTIQESNRIIAFPPSWYGAGTFPWDIYYEGKSNLIEAILNYDINEQVRIGAYGNYYQNNGFWEISRTMLKSYIEYMFVNRLVFHLGYRYIDFKEENSGYNDYSANIFEFSFGYRWD